eukprot:CAMPEP_0184699186 /NCGR_PEP_ID=MMETSP0313-20130426/5543_1 /TAXON_ID=2792 /ORGANISM="Porphyridium aerugineum, Strain SAG 1380-2" /LENGTH=1093 /DNA_ID=CAMNT_0027158233 /DNA_START=275 /DNA_END=3556 /DNA_ORIENTATION=-
MASKRYRSTSSIAPSSASAVVLLLALILTSSTLSHVRAACNLPQGQFDCNGVSVTGQISQDKSSSTATFRNATLFFCNFIRNTLNNADFYGVSLTNVVFQDGSLKDASFFGAISSSYRFQNMDCDGIDMSQAFMNFGIISKTTLRNSNWNLYNSNGQSEFSESILDGSNFELGRFINQIFTDSSLKNVNSLAGSWSSCTFSRVNIDNSLWNSSLIILTMFNDFTATNIKARATRVTNSEIRNVTFVDSYMDQFRILGGVDSVTTGVTFRNTDLRSAVFKDIGMTGMTFTSSNLGGSFFDGTFMNSSSSSGSNFRGSDYQDAYFSELVSSGDTFDNSFFNMTTLYLCEVSGSSFKNINANNLYFLECTFDDVSFEGASINNGSFFGSIDLNAGSVSFKNSDLTNSTFRNSSFSSGIFAGATMTATRLRGIAASGGDFTNVNGRGVNFEPLPLAVGEFRESLLTNAKFDNSELPTGIFSYANLGGASFKNANLKGAFFRYADVSNVDWTGADLSGADFSKSTGLTPNCVTFCNSRGCLCDTIPVCPSGFEPAAGADCSNANIKDYTYIGSDFTATNFQNSKFNNVGFDSVSLERANLRNTEIFNLSFFDGVFAKNASYTGAKITNVEFLGSNLENTDWDGTEFRGSMLFSGVNLSNSKFENVEVYDSFILQDSYLPYTSLRRMSRGGSATIQMVNLDAFGMNGDEMSVVSSQWTNGNLDNSTFVGSNFIQASFNGVTFQFCNFLNAQFAEVNMTDSSFLSSNMSNIDFSDSVLLRTSLRDTDLQGASFNAANLTSVNFIRANLIDSQFLGAYIDPNCQFTGANCTGIKLDDNQQCEDFCAQRQCYCAPTPLPSVTATPSQGPFTETPSVTPNPSNPTTSPKPSFSPTPSGATPEPSVVPLPNAPCFPAYATVRLESGKEVRMDDLVVGTKIQVPGKSSGKVALSEVYLFGHRLFERYAEYVVIRLDNGKSLSVSPNHYVYVDGGKQLRLASRVEVGDALLLDNGQNALVLGAERRLEKGVFNPHTLHGDMFVDGVKVSSYTSAVPPVMGHILLAPVRAMYRLYQWNMLGGHLENSLPSWIYQVLTRVTASLNLLQ